MTFQVNFKVENNTDYNITVTHNTVGDLATVSPNSSWGYVTEDVNNTNALKFWQQPNIYFMQGSCSFGPEAGVYVDRGWMSPTSQTIKMTAVANGVKFIQIINGGETLVAWNQFTNGGNITLTFDKR